MRQVECATPRRTYEPDHLGGEDLTERAAVAARVGFGSRTKLCREVFELIERWIHSGQGELGLDDVQIEPPDVLEDAAVPAGRVVPALAWCACGVAAAAHHNQHRGPSGGRRFESRCQARIGQHEVDPGLEVL